MRVTRHASYLIVIFFGPGTTVGKRPGGEAVKKKKPPRRGSGEMGTERGAAQCGHRLGADSRLTPSTGRTDPPIPHPGAASALRAPGPRPPCPALPPPAPPACSPPSPPLHMVSPLLLLLLGSPPPCCRRAFPLSILCLRGGADGAARRGAGCGPGLVPGGAGREGCGPQPRSQSFPGVRS